MRSTFRAKCRAVWAGAAVVFAAGCQHTVNPFLDDLPATLEVTTASVEGARAAGSKPTLASRDFHPVMVEPQSGTVSHWPLWWQDPFEGKGSQDGQFAWTKEDFLCIAYGPGRFLVNIMGFPASVGMTMPWTVMCSDGHLSRQALGYDHDAARCPGGIAPPIDILEIGTFYEDPLELDGSGPAQPGEMVPSTSR